jgi:ABC-2 type transport system permease protein
MQAVQHQLNLRQAKLTAKQSAALATQVQFKQTVKHSEKKSFDSDPVKQISFWILLIILYMLVITYTQVTAQDIATEKGTKMMEVIFSSMPGGDYFTGKILGIFGEIITQVLIYVAGFTAVYFVAPYIDGFNDLFNKYKPMIDQAIGNLVSWGLLFTIIGLILFIIFAAFCGAIVVKSEDANKAVTPLTVLMLIGFLFTLNMSSGNDTILAQVLSYIPFLSSFVMPARVIMGDASNLEATISALIALIAASGSFIWIRKIYPGLILQTDDVGPWQNFKRSLLN